jgi:hypothetical protein
VEFEIGTNLAALLTNAPWAAFVAFALWPEKGAVALWIKRSQAVRVAEIERAKTADMIAVEVAKGNRQGQLPSPVGESE